MSDNRFATIDLDLDLTFETPISIGAGGSGGGFADKTILRDANNNLLLPGSHLKGRLRYACEIIARAAGYYVCGSPQAENICPQPGAGVGAIVAEFLPGAAGDKTEKYCIICQLFGSPGYASPLLFEDLSLADPDNSYVDVRPGVSINRTRKVAEDARLFFVETSRPGLKPVFQKSQAISGRLLLVENGPTEVEYRHILEAGLKFLRQWGGGKTRGLGWANLKSSVTTDFSGRKIELQKEIVGKELLITFKTLSPLSLSERKPDAQFRRSASYISGRALKGALAMHLNRHGQTELWNTLFATEHGQLTSYYGHALPLDKEKGAGKSFFAPVTARQCKENQEEHPIFDTVFDILGYELWLAQRGVFVPPPSFNCPFEGCNGRSDSVGGFLLKADDTYYSVSSPGQRLLTRVGINRQRLAAEDGLLYSPIVIEEGTSFQAHIRLESEEIVLQLADFLSQNSEFHLGGGVSRGLGLIKIIGLETINKSVDSPIRDRVKEFNRKLLSHLTGQWGLEIKNKLFITLTARSELAIQHPALPQLGSALLEELKLVRAFATTTVRSGWNSAWGLMGDIRLLVRAGSVYLYEVPKSLEENPAFYSAVEELERVGVGEESGSGYGAITLCDPFHYSVKEKYYGESRTQPGRTQTGKSY